jgi:hypothetical protein
VAYPIGVAQYGYCRIIHYVANEFIASARDNQVDKLIQSKHFLYIFTGFEQAEPAFGQAGIVRSLRDNFSQYLVSASCLTP